MVDQNHSMHSSTAFESINRASLTRQETLTIHILGKLTAHDLIEINHMHQDFGSAEILERHQPSRTRDEPSVRRNRNRMQETDLVNVFGERLNVARLLAKSVADDDTCDRARHERHGQAASSWLGIGRASASM